MRDSANSNIGYSQTFTLYESVNIKILFISNVNLILQQDKYYAL